MGRLRYKGYYGSVEFSEQDDCFVGHALGLRRACILYEGDSVESLRRDFEGAIDDYLASCEADGIKPETPYSGKFVIRIASDLHATAAEKAASLGISLNEFITRAISAAL